MRNELIATAFAALIVTATTASTSASPITQFCGDRICETSQAQQTQNRAGRYRANYDDSRVVGHPPGCPRRAFCGCGVSVKVFGRPIRDLFLAANWLRKFSRTAPASGMVAARRGHVMYILSYSGNGTALVYDPNSGGHRTRIHTRSLAGYVVVNPHSPRYASN